MFCPTSFFSNQIQIQIDQFEHEYMNIHPPPPQLTFQFRSHSCYKYHILVKGLWSWKIDEKMICPLLMKILKTIKLFPCFRYCRIFKRKSNLVNLTTAQTGFTKWCSGAGRTALMIEPKLTILCDVLMTRYQGMTIHPWNWTRGETCL